jgi:HTH-type transcriptional regulator/antitoxin HigA
MKTREIVGAPVILTAPGEILRQELEARALSQRAFAEIIGRPEQAVSEIIRGRKHITADTALDFAEALNIEAEFWLNLEVNYQLDLARTQRHLRLVRVKHRPAAKNTSSRAPARRPRLAAAKTATTRAAKSIP